MSVFSDTKKSLGHGVGDNPSMKGFNPSATTTAPDTTFTGVGNLPKSPAAPAWKPKMGTKTETSDFTSQMKNSNSSSEFS